VPVNLEIVVERPDLYVITCNGAAVKEAAYKWWLDKAFGRIDLSRVARLGQNVVTLKASPFAVFHELESAYVIGDFSLSPSSSGFVIEPDQRLRLAYTRSSEAKPKDAQQQGWNNQGHPFYSAGVAYTEDFEVPENKSRFSVVLPSWYGSVARVTINGKHAGYIDAPPWECDVTKWIRSGRNAIEVTVIGTLKNTLGPHHGNPTLGAAWPANFQKAPNPGPPPGTNYSTVAYGLFEPFVLKQVTNCD
jgi:hypothetical protein